jgi:hypothetical protein
VVNRGVETRGASAANSQTNTQCPLEQIVPDHRNFHLINMHLRRAGPRLVFGIACVAAGWAAWSIAGCTALGFVGAMAKSFEQTGSHVVKPKYEGLEGKSFVVVVAADRSIQADNPEIVPLMTREVANRLAENCGASGIVPAEDVLRFQYQRPGWLAMTPYDLAKEFDVQRLVYIEMQNFSTTDHGNPYIWNGQAAATVQVLETDGKTPDVFTFRETVRVKYPDQEGLSPMQIPAETVRLELSRRIITRVSWLFFEHEEPNAIKY